MPQLGYDNHCNYGDARQKTVASLYSYIMNRCGTVLPLLQSEESLSGYRHENEENGNRVCFNENALPLRRMCDLCCKKQLHQGESLENAGEGAIQNHRGCKKIRRTAQNRWRASPANRESYCESIATSDRLCKTCPISASMQTDCRSISRGHVACP